MPRKPKRPCSYPGCPNLTDGRFCPEHEKKEAKRYEKYDRDPNAKRYTGNSKCWWTHPRPEEPENLMGYQWWQSCLNRCYFRLLSCEQQNNHKRWLTFTYNFWFYCCYWFRQFPQQFAALYHMLYVEKDCLIFIRSYQMVAAFLISNFRNGGTYQ